jgi:hypothetical protein
VFFESFRQFLKHLEGFSLYLQSFLFSGRFLAVRWESLPGEGFLSQELTQESIRDELARLKDQHERKFQHLSDNFYIMRSALRYFSVKRGRSFTSSRVAEDFPMPVTVAGSCLSALEMLEVIESRTRSSSPDRYLPGKVDLERMESVREVLLENFEIGEFRRSV